MITHQKFRSAEDVGDLFRAGEQPIGAAYMASPSGHERTGLGGLRRFSAQLAIAAVAAGVMLLTAAIGGTQ